MRQVKLLADLTTPAGVLPVGTEMAVDDAEAKLLLGARGLAEDLGPAEAPEPAADREADAAADTDGADKPRRRAR